MFYFNYVRLFLFALIIVSIFSFSPSSFGQSKIGLAVGRTYSRFDIIGEGGIFQDFSTKYDHKGLKANVYYSYKFNKFIGVTPSIGYAKRGAIITRDYGIAGLDKFSYHYLDLTASIDFSPIKFINLSIGLNNNYLIRAESHWYNNIGNETEFYPKFDLGYELGGAIIFKGVRLHACYFKSIKPIQTLGFPSISPTLKNLEERRNESLEFSIGYEFKLNKKKKRE